METIMATVSPDAYVLDLSPGDVVSAAGETFTIVAWPRRVARRLVILDVADADGFVQTWNVSPRATVDDLDWARDAR